jgi:hypothetical protein
MSNELWCIYIAGPDDLVAMPSKAVAEAVARNFNAVWDRYGAERGHDVRAVAHVEPWMHGKAAHSEDLRKNFWEYADLVLDDTPQQAEQPRGEPVLGGCGWCQGAAPVPDSIRAQCRACNPKPEQAVGDGVVK